MTAVPCAKLTGRWVRIALPSSAIRRNSHPPLPHSCVRDDRGVRLHGSEQELPQAGSAGGLLRLLLHPGLGQLPHDARQRPHVPGAQEAQIDATGSAHRHAHRYTQQTPPTTNLDNMHEDIHFSSPNTVKAFSITFLSSSHTQKHEGIRCVHPSHRKKPPEAPRCT